MTRRRTGLTMRVFVSRTGTVLLACAGCIASGPRNAGHGGPDESALAFVTEGELESWELPLWMTQPLSWPAGARAEGLGGERSSEIRKGAAEWIRLCVKPELLPEDLEDQLQLFSDAFVLDRSWKRRRRKADAAAVRYVVGGRSIQIIDALDRVVICVRTARAAPEKDKSAMLEFCRAVTKEILHPSLQPEDTTKLYFMSDALSRLVEVGYFHPRAEEIPRQDGEGGAFLDRAGCPFRFVEVRARGRLCRIDVCNKKLSPGSGTPSTYAPRFEAAPGRREATTESRGRPGWSGTESEVEGVVRKAAPGHHKDWKTRRDAFERLEALGRGAIPELLRLLGSDEYLMRSIAASQLVKLADSRTLPALLAATESDRSADDLPRSERWKVHLRSRIVRHVDKFGLPPDQTMAIRRDAVASPSSQVRAVAITELAQLGTKEALELIASRLDDRKRVHLISIDGPYDPVEVRHYAAAALEYVTGRYFVCRLIDDEYIYETKTKLSYLSPDYGIPLRQMNRAARAWRRWWKREGKDYHPPPVEPEGEVARLLRESYSKGAFPGATSSRTKARRKLRAMGKEATPELVRLIREDPRFRRRALVALCGIGDPQALPAVLEVFGLAKGKKPLEDRPFFKVEIISWLESFNLDAKRFIEVLRVAIRDESPEVRIAAIEQLAARPTPDGMTLIAGRLNDEGWRREPYVWQMPHRTRIYSPRGPQVRDYAVGALEHITGKHFVAKFLTRPSPGGHMRLKDMDDLQSAKKTEAARAWREWWKKEGKTYEPE